MGPTACQARTRRPWLALAKIFASRSTRTSFFNFFSSSNGLRSRHTATNAGLVWWATSRSLWPTIRPTFGPTPTNSNWIRTAFRLSSPVFRQTISAPLVNSGVTRFTTGNTCLRTDSNGGSDACTLRYRLLTSYASITSAALRRAGKFRAAIRLPSVDAGSKRPVENFSRRSGTSSAKLPIIAEDLGVITPDVERLRDDFGFPGMRILQFGFSSDTKNIDLPHNYHQNVVVYTGTHDNDTTVGWFNSVAGEGSTRTAAANQGGARASA